MRKFIAPFAFFACYTAGCASAPEKKEQETSFIFDGAVSADIVDEPTNERYKVLPGEKFFRELPRGENARPVYPASLLAKQLEPVSIIARIVVNGTGEVERAEIVESSTPIPEFSESVLVALRTWTFIPLMRVTGSKFEPLPFTQDYKFTFTQENGRAIVVQGSSRDS
jgi:TonB family protein